MKRIRLALIYDFDGTLAPGNMQEHSFIPSLGMKSGEFWEEANKLARENDVGPVLAYMHVMLARSRELGVPVGRDMLRKHAERLPLFPGVDMWFDTVGREHGDIVIEHFIISSGLREMIRGTAIASEFTRIFASDFIYDSAGIAVGTGLEVNYTNKTQFLFRINKGAYEVWDGASVNRPMSDTDRPIPFSNMIYFGDGETDVPCIRVLSDNGGHAIGVYAPESAAAKEGVDRLVRDGRVRHAMPADFREGKPLLSLVRKILTLIRAQHAVAECRV